MTLRRILAVRLDNVGDVVMLTPALRLLRESYPDAWITLLATPAGMRVAPLLPWIDEAIPLRPLWQDLSGALPFDPERERAVVERLREREFDAAILFTSFSQSPHPAAYVCRAAGIPVRIGRSKEFEPGSLTHAAPAAPDEMHQTDRNLTLLERLGLRTLRVDPELRVPEQAEQAAAERLARAGIEPEGPFIACAPGASCASRRWSPLRFGQTLALLMRETGWRAVLLGSENEDSLAGAVRERAPEAVPLMGGSVAELAALIRRARLLIANNSGPMHIADAVRTPMVILFSGTDSVSQWEPRCAPAVVLTRPVTCAPCRAFECPYGMECLDFLPEEVARAASQLRERTGGIGADSGVPAGGVSSAGAGEPACADAGGLGVRDR